MPQIAPRAEAYQSLIRGTQDRGFGIQSALKWILKKKTQELGMFLRCSHMLSTQLDVGLTRHCDFVVAFIGVKLATLM